MRFRWRSSRRGPRRVVFVVQLLELFDQVAPVVRALRGAGWMASIVVTPLRDASHASSTGSYDLAAVRPVWESLAARGYAPEPLVPVEDEAARIRDLAPVAAFVPTPYDGQRHESLHVSNLEVPVHYVNYGFDVSPPQPGIEFDNPFYRQCSAIYTENDYCTAQFKHAGISASRIVKAGPPALDRWDTERPRAEVPTILWCPYWSARFHGPDGWTVGYSTFISSYRAVLDEAARRPHVHFIVRPHPLLWRELRSESLWSEEEESNFHARIAQLDNVRLEGGSHVGHFEQAWAMVTDGISFLAEFGYTGKPILLTQAAGNPGWAPNPVGMAIHDVVQRSDAAEGLGSFLDQVERNCDPERGHRREVIRGLFYRPPGGSAAAIVRHLDRVYR